LNFPPLLLRIMLGGIVLWMGLGKIMGKFEVDGQRAATLANMGVTLAPVALPKATEPAKPAETPKPSDSKGGAQVPRNPAVTLVSQQTNAAKSPGQYTAADFPNPISVRTLHVLSLSIADAAQSKDKDGNPVPSIWPEALAKGPWPVYIAWTAAIVETLAGVGLLVGLLTRLWALLLTGRMLAAIWLATIGPAIRSGHAVLGFLPDYPTFDAEKWKTPMLQLALLATAAALLFLGPGRASVDHAIFAPPREDDDEESE
jgi:uncharacterized membrane protein YphA (DoxX/SURF4 family)